MRKALFLLLACFLLADKIPKITADYQKISGDLLIAKGDVEVSSELGKLYADQMEVNLKTGDVHLIGNVAVIFDSGFIAGKEGFYNYKTGKLRFVNVWGWLQKKFFFQAEEVRASSKKEFSFKKIWFTPCNQTCPLWETRAKRGKYYRDDHISLWGTVLRIKGIPVLYLPYLYYPASKKERKTGFLMPKFGHSSNRGYYFGEDFYWAPADWLDFTFSYDYMSQLGHMFTGEYRYVWSDGNYGNLRASYFKYWDGKADYLVKGNEVLDMGRGWRLTANADLVSSYKFLWNISTNYFRIVQRFFYSSAYLTKSWEDASLVLRADEQKSYLGGETVFRHLPELNFTFTRKRIIGNLYFSGGLIASNIQEQRKKKTYDLRRIIWKPSLVYTLSPAPWISLDNRLSLHMAYYTQQLRDEERIDEPLRIFAYSYSATITGPVFYRIFKTPNLAYSPKFKHVIEPSVSLVFSPDYDYFPRIVSYDGYDYFPASSHVDFSLTNRVLAKKKVWGERTPVEILSFSIGGSYYPKTENVITPLGLPVSHKFSSVNMNLRFTPDDSFSLYWIGQYEPYDKYFLFNSITLSLRPRGLPFYVSGNYFTTKSVFEETSLISNQMRLSGGIAISPLGLSLSGFWFYDIGSKKTRQYTIIANLNLQCVRFIFRFAYMPFRKEKYFFNISFSLPQVGFGIDRFGG